EAGRLVQTRPAFGGRVMASILTKNARPQVATIRPGIFLDCEIKSVKNEIKIMELPQNIKTKLLIKEARRLNKETDEQCDHIIAVGGGLKTKDELGLFQELADKMNAKLMCSRALVERGWMTQDKQIGLSGQSVSSEYLLTFGISGSVQFLSGVKGVKKLCAVCNDKKADIFDVADLPVLGDMIEIAKAMVKKEI
ncbi:MAG: electron transfer flavoprotein subunit alpha/FixB family protein, partial [Eubacterium sp.]